MRMWIPHVIRKALNHLANMIATLIWWKVQSLMSRCTETSILAEQGLLLCSFCAEVWKKEFSETCYASLILLNAYKEYITPREVPTNQTKPIIDSSLRLFTGKMLSLILKLQSISQWIHFTENVRTTLTESCSSFNYSPSTSFRRTFFHALSFYPVMREVWDDVYVLQYLMC